jgi:hypothetical protein
MGMCSPWAILKKQIANYAQFFVYFSFLYFYLLYIFQKVSKGMKLRNIAIKEVKNQFQADKTM